jgi:predicted N-acyltransferase
MSRPPPDATAHLRIVPAIADVEAAAWDRCANPDAAMFNPFQAHAFLAALEAAGTVGDRSGWTPQHLVLGSADGRVLAVAPAYLKSHSQGEYVFDHGWADAYQRAGGRYYPKLQLAVPFTPVPGRRFLVPPGPDHDAHERLLAAAAIEFAKRKGLSSMHATFVSEGEWGRLGASGLLQRTDQQFHWKNEGYRTFDDFLGSLASRKRKMMRKERDTALSAGLKIDRIRGRDITEAHWDAFYGFYMDTGSRKWGRPYLNRAFFSELGARMAEHCLLVLVTRAGRPIAGALNLIGGDCLYGRYWGCVEQHPCLHFEVCYYQAIEYAIEAGLARVEAGAQGDHKLARGYLPVATYSLHWIADSGFRDAVARFLREERAHMAEQREMLAEYAPYRKTVSAADA